MKKILIIGSLYSGKKNNPLTIAQGFDPSDDEVEVLYWENLLFRIETNRQEISHCGKNIFEEKPDLVIAIGWYKNGKKSIYRDVAFCLALFLKHNNIPFWNSEMLHQRSVTKLSCMMQLALEGIPIPSTYFSLRVSEAIDGRTLPFIAKAAAASRGDMNFLVTTNKDLEKVNNVDSYFLIQSYLVNDHDLRVICFNNKPTLVLKRSRINNSLTHLNNASLGAETEWLELSDLNPELLTLSEKICKITNREMGGIDFIPDHQSTIGYSCLEVNAVPQLTSGTDSKRKLAAFAKVINNI